MVQNYRLRLPEVSRPADRRLGRHVNHDPRSKAYAVEPAGIVESARWPRISEVLDQGNLGSCTGNAAVGVLGTTPFASTLPSTLQLDEAYAVRLYSAATNVDDYQGAYPPTDTGSDGLSVAKVCKAVGLISGYRHILSLDAAHTAIMSGPFIVGTEWRADMDEPDELGVVHAAGAVRGGHEYECIGFDAGTGRWEFVNSWGAEWGAGGHFFISDAGFADLLAHDGDATVFSPLGQPAPVPTPEPHPIDVDRTLAEATRAWSAARHNGENKAAAAAVTAWRQARGL